jgi:D-arabinose 1-dehydrogenase-like Zn-dependent alcohol dehydrogenase
VRARWIDDWGGKLRDGDRPDPRPGRGELRIAVEACGVGLTVLNCIAGDLGDDPADLPRIPGHELVGRVDAVGEGVDRDLLGRRAMAYFYLCCGACRMCLAGEESLCERLAGQVGVHRDGGYAERVVLPVVNAVPLPEGIDAVLATAIPDAIATPLHVARRAGLAPALRVAVVAAGGGVGVHMVQVAALHGCEVVGLEASAGKLAFLEGELGVDAVESSDFGAVRLPTGWSAGADVVVDLLGTRESLAWGLGALGPNGRLVVLTTFRDVAVELSPRTLVFGQHAVLASRYASRHELVAAAGLVERGALTPIVSRCAGPGEVDALHDMLRAGGLVGRAALKW